MKRYDSYIICTSPRSGSTLLCRMLRNTGLAGHPESWFHRPDIEDWRRALELTDGASLQDIVDAAKNAGRAGTDMFGLRLQRHSFDYAMAQFHKLCPGRSSDPACLEACFGRILYVHLERVDTLAQAVSYVHATQSGLWHRHADGSELERLSEPEPEQYNEEAITRQMQSLGQQNTAWRNWFDHHGIAPLRLQYESLAQEPKSGAARVMKALGVSFDMDDLALPTARLSDSVNQDWIARYRKSYPQA